MKKSRFLIALILALFLHQTGLAQNSKETSLYLSEGIVVSDIKNNELNLIKSKYFQGAILNSNYIDSINGYYYEFTFCGEEIICVSYFANQKLRSEGRYLISDSIECCGDVAVLNPITNEGTPQMIKTGEWIEYGKSEKLKSVGFFINNLKSGKWEIFENNKLMKIEFYENGNLVNNPESDSAPFNK
tara:strand:+ start:48 stop:608 length:561 start_codon:yes stop_codon:yes gene_type:complete